LHSAHNSKQSLRLYQQAVRTAYMRVLNMIVHNCGTHYSTKQFWNKW